MLVSDLQALHAQQTTSHHFKLQYIEFYFLCRRTESSHVVNIPVFFHISIHIAEQKILQGQLFSNIVQPELEDYLCK